jgi:hypothetical protein
MNCCASSRFSAEIFSSNALENSGCQRSPKTLSFFPHLGAERAESSDPLAVNGFQSAEVLFFVRRLKKPGAPRNDRAGDE